MIPGGQSLPVRCRSSGTVTRRIMRIRTGAVNKGLRES